MIRCVAASTQQTIIRRARTTATTTTKATSCPSTRLSYVHSQFVPSSSSSPIAFLSFHDGFHNDDEKKEGSSKYNMPRVHWTKNSIAHYHSHGNWSNAIGGGWHQQQQQRRWMSNNSNNNGNISGDTATTAAASQNDTTSATTFIPSMGSSPIPDESQSTTYIDPSLFAEPWDPTWYNTADQVVNLIHSTAQSTGLNYAITIASITTIVRIGLFPLFVSAQRNSSRIAHMKPEMDMLRAKVDKMDPTSKKDPQLQIQYGNEMRALFQKYDCHPMRSITMPLVQFPIFMSMFFGLRKMPTYFPTPLSEGGMWWFVDLTVPDPYYIMPFVCGASFIVMMELGKDQMLASDPKFGRIMLNTFRAMGIVLVPLTGSFPAAIFCYWTTNNLLSLIQGGIMKNSFIRKQFGIWDPPKPLPGQKPPPTMMDMIQDALKKKEPSASDKIKAHNEAIDNRKKAIELMMMADEEKEQQQQEKEERGEENSGNSSRNRNRGGGGGIRMRKYGRNRKIKRSRKS